MMARFRLTSGYRTGAVVRLNHHTVWVRFTRHGKPCIIQRHRRKHDVSLLQEA